MFLDQNEFGNFFEGMMLEVLRENAMRNDTVVPERMKVLEQAAEGFTRIIGRGEAANMKLHPEFRSGGISIKVPDVNLNADEVFQLREILKCCDTFEVIQHTDGQMSVTATVKGIFAPEA